VLFELYTENKHRTQNTASGGSFFGGACKTSKLIPKFFMGVCSGKSIHILFQMWSKLVQDKYPKGRVGDGKNKTHLAEPLGQFPKFFYWSAHCGPALIF